MMERQISTLERQIIEKLLAKYEASAHYANTSATSHRVRLKLGPGSRDLKAYDIENSEQRNAVHAAILHLKEAGLVDFAWERYNVGNVMEKVWLDLDCLTEAYAFIGRTPKRAIISHVMQHINTCYTLLAEQQQKAARDTGTDRPDPQPLMYFAMTALRGIIELNAASGKVAPLLPDDPKVAINVANALYRLPSMGPTPLRLFSIQLFQDSKYFERNIQAPLVALARRFHPAFNGDAVLAEQAEESPSGAASADEILATLGIVRNPEIYEFCGYIKLTFNGARVDYIAFPFGSCLISSSIDTLTAIDASRISRLLFIENRTNYEAYISGDHQTDLLRASELVIYHGGYHGPTKSRFLRMLVQALPPEATVQHWGDIDLGGLRIFLQIRSNIAPRLQPWRMDVQTLLENKDRAVPFSQNYRSALEKALINPAFQDFRDVIEAMLASGLRLEQEALIQ